METKEKKPLKRKKSITKKNTSRSKNIIDVNIEKKKIGKKTVRNMNKKTDKKQLDKTNILLQIVFFLLLVVVVVLGVMVVKKDSENKNKVVANIVIPVFEKDNQSSVTINAESLSKDYIVKVTNYKSVDNINKEEMSYDVNIQNNTSANVIVKKEKTGNNLMSSKNTVIKGEKLKKSVKENVYYYISVDDLSKVKSKEKIVFKIVS